MYKKTVKKSRSSGAKIILVILAVLLVLAATFAVLEKTNVTNFIKTKDAKNNQVDDNNANSTSKLPSAQSDFNTGNKRSTETTNKTEGIVTDNQGQVGSVPPESSWTKSASGVISVYNPTKTSLLKSGDKLSGESSASKVFYRLNDNVSGMIATGSVNVVNGKFSGTFSFSTTASEGQVDVFTQAADGTESNNIAIPIRFK